MKKNLLLVMLAGLLLTGCPSQPPKDDADTSQNQTTKSDQEDSVQTGKLDDAKQTEGTSFNAGEEPYRKDAINDANSPLSQKVIYFDFNASNVKDEYRDLITWHGRYLASNEDMKVRLEGHTDERGSREYNIALGEKRAKAVKQIMTLQGVTDNQIQVISFGEERPVASGHDESAWNLNRRVEILYTGY